MIVLTRRSDIRMQTYESLVRRTSVEKVTLPDNGGSIPAILPLEKADPNAQALPEPPSGDHSDAGIKRRLSYVRRVSENSAVAGRRFSSFIETQRQLCLFAIQHDEGTAERLWANQLISGVDDGLFLVWEALHSPTGILQRFVTQAKLHAEYRLFARYGDYAARAIGDLKGKPWIWGACTDREWHSILRVWQREQVSPNVFIILHPKAHIHNPQANFDAWSKRRNGPPPPTRWSDKMSAEASSLGMSKDDVISAVAFYVERNRICHSGLDELSDIGDFQSLGELVKQDLETLEALDNGSKAHKGLRRCVEKFSKKWFDSLERDASDKVVVGLNQSARDHIQKIKEKKEQERREQIEKTKRGKWTWKK